MAHKLPDEVLKEILAPPLVISDDEFSYASIAGSPFGRTPRHSSNLLLVCKHWMRVATPLLYEVAIIRSTAQAQSLAYAIKSNKAFGTFIRRLRMEGGFGKAPAIFIAAAPNIRELFVTLDLWSNDSPSGLCSVLSGMNPRRLIIVNHNYWLQNAKAVQLWDNLSLCINKWSSMATLEYHSIEPENCKDFFDNLTTLPPIKHFVLTHFNMIVLTRLASITSVETIRITRLLLPSQSSVVASSPRLLKFLQFKSQAPEKPIPAVLPFASVVSGFTPLMNVPLHVAKSIWDLIFSFATCTHAIEKMSGPPSPNDVIFRQTRSKFTSTARSLSLVSKYFHETVKRHLFSVIHIRKYEKLEGFALIVKRDEYVSSFVRVLRFFPRECDVVGGEEELLAQLLPKLAGLISLNISISIDHLHQLKALIQLSSTTLHFLALDIRWTVNSHCNHRELQTVDIGNLAGLTHLECIFHITSKRPRAHLTSPMQSLIAQLPNLTSLDTGLFPIPGDGLDLLYEISMPSLESLRMSVRSPMTAKFLMLNGNTLRILDISDTPSPALLAWCPRLESVTVRHHPVANFFVAPGGKPYPSLSQLRMDHCRPSTGNLEKRLVAITEGFEDVDFSLFPNLKEVHMHGFTWPNTERDIKKTPRFGSFALCLKKWGITVYDRTGTPWRERAQIRRGR